MLCTCTLHRLQYASQRLYCVQWLHIPDNVSDMDSSLLFPQTNWKMSNAHICTAHTHSTLLHYPESLLQVGTRWVEVAHSSDEAPWWAPTLLPMSGQGDTDPASHSVASHWCAQILVLLSFDCSTLHDIHPKSNLYFTSHVSKYVCHIKCKLQVHHSQQSTTTCNIFNMATLSGY